MKMNRKSFLAAALAGLVAGCISYHTPPMDRRVTVAPDLGAAVWVTDVRLAKGPSSHFTLQANVVNNTSGVVRMEYRVDCGSRCRRPRARWCRCRRRRRRRRRWISVSMCRPSAGNDLKD